MKGEKGDCILPVIQRVWSSAAKGLCRLGAEKLAEYDLKKLRNQLRKLSKSNDVSCVVFDQKLVTDSAKLTSYSIESDG